MREKGELFTMYLGWGKNNSLVVVFQMVFGGLYRVALKLCSPPPTYILLRNETPLFNITIAFFSAISYYVALFGTSF